MSAGDVAGSPEYPSTSPNVVSVGGTSIDIKNGAITKEIAWSESGGGPSAYEARPSFQTGVASIVQSVRGTPDLVAVADPATSVPVYDSTPLDGATGWMVIGGTSLSASIAAATANAQSAFYPSSSAFLATVYGGIGTEMLRDVVSGKVGSFSAKPGWDFASGCGTLVVAPTPLPPTIAAPNPGALPATQNGTVSYPFVVSDRYHPSRTITAVRSSGPSWVTWDGSTLTVSPPANLRAGDYPLSLTASQPGHPENSLQRSLLIRVAAPALSTAKWNSTAVTGGGNATLLISLTAPAPHGGISVKLASKSSFVTITSPQNFSEGVSTISVSIPTSAVAKPTLVTVDVSYNGKTVPATIRVNPQ